MVVELKQISRKETQSLLQTQLAAEALPQEMERPVVAMARTVVAGRRLLQRVTSNLLEQPMVATELLLQRVTSNPEVVAIVGQTVEPTVLRIVKAEEPFMEMPCHRPGARTAAVATDDAVLVAT